MYVALGLSLLLAILGAVGIASPERLVALLRRLQTTGGLYGIAGLRFVLGAALLLVAPESKAPDLVRLFGIIAIVAGIATPFFGLERFRRITDWWESQGEFFLRVWAVFPLVLGLYLAWAVAP
jgi:hypothetical protein